MSMSVCGKDILFRAVHRVIIKCNYEFIFSNVEN